VRHEFGHVLMCNAGLDSEPSTEKEDVAEAIGQLLTPANESRIAFYLDNSALSSAEWAEARNVIAGSL
jgi:hypothetical protein